jgi:hypothetical protein
MTIRSDTRSSNCFPLVKVTHIVQRCGLALTGAASGLFVAAHLVKANVDVFESIGLIFAMIRFGFIGFHLGNDITPLSREAGIGVSPKADVAKVYSAAGAFLVTVAALVSAYVVVFEEGLPVVWVVIVALCWLSGATMQIIVRLRVRRRLGRRTTPRDRQTRDGWAPTTAHQPSCKACSRNNANLASRVASRMRSVV